MAKINSWLGNDQTNSSLRGNELNKFAGFCNSHETVYIFGAGKIGSAIRHYMEQSGLACAGFITSETIGELRKKYCKGESGIIIGVCDKFIPEVQPLLSEFISESDIFQLSSQCRELMGRQLSVEYTRDNFWINIFVTNKCNMACKSCSTFSPVMPFCKSDTDYELSAFEKDMFSLQKLNLPVIKNFKFTGGETLLHPQIFEMFSIVHSLFPQNNIECYTNGILLIKMNDPQLKALKDLGVTLTITEYPLERLDLARFYKTADEMGINYQIIGKGHQKKFFKRSLNFNKNTPKHHFFECLRYAACNSLFMYNGKLWKCIYSFNSKLLNEAFSTNFELVEGDYLDLYNTTPNEIYNFAISRIPFCGYCKPITELIPWSLSERKIEEWT